MSGVSGAGVAIVRTRLKSSRLNNHHNLARFATLLGWYDGYIRLGDSDKPPVATVLCG
jgi:hypothetical protein